MRMIACAALTSAALLVPGAAFAADINTLLNQKEGPVVLYNAPQDGIFTQQTASGLLAPDPSGKVTVYGLTQDGKDYVVGEGEWVEKQDISITGKRTIVQKGEVQEWLKVDTASGSGGWLQAPSKKRQSLEAIAQ